MKVRFHTFLSQCLATIALLLAISTIARGQSQIFGALGGAVTDPQKAAVPGASVTARSLATDATTTTTTDGAGRFLIDNLQPGAYEVTISASSFATVTEPQIIVEVGLVTPINTQLGLAGQTATISVTSDAPVVNTEQSVFATDVNLTSIQNLPINSRRWSNFALSTPGTVPDGTFGDVSYRGVSYIFNNNTVDGAANTQSFFPEEVGRTRMAYSTSLNAIQEFQVTTDNYSAEYGRAVGGVVNAVTKSGSNQFHGSLFYFIRDNAIGGAYTPFATEAFPNSSGIYGAPIPVKPVDVRQQMGGDIGGPIIKNKLFFYFNFDDQIHRFPLVDVPSTPNNFFAPVVVAMPSSCVNGSANALYSGSNAPKNLTTGQVLACRGFTQAQVNPVVSLIDSLTGTAPRTGDQTIWFPKIDWKPNDKNSFSFSATRTNWVSPYGVQTGTTVARSIDSVGNDYVKDQRGVANWTITLTPTMTNQARFFYSRDFEFEFPNASLPGEPISPLTGFSPGADINGCGFSTAGATLACGLDIGAPYYLPRTAYPDERRVEGSDTFSWSKGNHLLKFGVNIAHVNDYLNAYSQQQYGEYAYTYYQDFISDYLASVDHINGGLACDTTALIAVPCYASYGQTFGPAAFNVDTLETGLFVQDDWHLNTRLTLNLGLRWDHEGFPTPVLPNPAIPQTTTFPSSKKDFGPRFGFAWDMFGTGKTVIRGGYGVYVGRITNEQIYEGLVLTGLSTGQLNPTIFPTTGSANNTGLLNAGAPIYPNTLASYNASAGSPNITFFPSDTRLPQAEEFDLILEHEIAPNTVVSLSYIGSIGRFLPTGVDINLPAPGTVNYTIVGGTLNGQVETLPFFAGPRPNPAYQQMVMYCTCVTSHYNGGVVQLVRRMRNGLQFNMNYTYASNTDDGASSAAITTNTPVNPFNVQGEYGNSILDVKNRFVGTVIWTPGYFEKSSNMASRWLLSNWTFSLTQTAQSGIPYTATITGNAPAGITIGGLTGTVSSGPEDGKTSTRVPFIARNNTFLPPTENTDVRVERGFPIWERARMDFTFEVFNLINHVNYSAATTTAYTTGTTTGVGPTLTYSTGFGGLTNANNGVFFTARQIQLGAKFSF